MLEIKKNNSLDRGLTEEKIAYLKDKFGDAKWQPETIEVLEGVVFNHELTKEQIKKLSSYFLDPDTKELIEGAYQFDSDGGLELIYDGWRDDHISVFRDGKYFYMMGKE